MLIANAWIEADASRGVLEALTCGSETWRSLLECHHYWLWKFTSPLVNPKQTSISRNHHLRRQWSQSYSVSGKSNGDFHFQLLCNYLPTWSSPRTTFYGQYNPGKTHLMDRHVYIMIMHNFTLPTLCAIFGPINHQRCAVTSLCAFLMYPPSSVRIFLLPFLNSKVKSQGFDFLTVVLNTLSKSEFQHVFRTDGHVRPNSYE